MISADGFAMSGAIRNAYKNGVDDELLEPLVLVDGSKDPIGRIKKGDCVIFYNIRGEREIELTESLTDDNFDRFPVESMSLNFATMIEYKKGLNAKVAFPPYDVVSDTLSDVLAKHNLRQVKIMEAEKAVHMGFFLNGKKSEPVEGEERIVIPTRKDIKLPDEAPEMSIEKITEEVVGKIRDKNYDFIAVNFPNVDVVGHVENEKAAIEAVEAVDGGTGVVVNAALEEGVTVIVTADHGTVEQWFYPDGMINTGHTDSPVPFLVIRGEEDLKLRQKGELADIAPTVLHIMDIEKPEVMTGNSLIESELKKTSRRVLLLILDGWGLNKSEYGNLIFKARTPVMDALMNRCPFSVLDASGGAVGLSDGVVGNSEAGHLHIGAGRRICSDRVGIDNAISDGSFFENSTFLEAIRGAKDSSSALHLLGIVSFFSSHGSIDHLFALMDLVEREGLKNVFIHAMLGRRGEKPESGAIYIEKIEKKCQELRLGRVVSVIGRYWSMDREENWDRIEKTYRMLVCGEGKYITEGGGLWK